MKNIYSFVLFILVGLFIMFGFTNAVNPSDGYYYWYKGEKIPLTLQVGKKFVLFNQSLEPTSLHQSVKLEKLQLGASLVRHKKSVPEKAIYWAVVPDNNKITLGSALTLLPTKLHFFTHKVVKNLACHICFM